MVDVAEDDEPGGMARNQTLLLTVDCLVQYMNLGKHNQSQYFSGVDTL